MTTIHFTMNSRQERFSKLASLLKRLKRNIGKKLSDIIRKCDNDLICSLSECFDNITKGNIPLTLAQKAKLHRHKQNLGNSLKKMSVNKRKKILERSVFLNALIATILSVLGSLFNGTR